MKSSKRAISLLFPVLLSCFAISNAYIFSASASGSPFVVQDGIGFSGASPAGGSPLSDTIDITGFGGFPAGISGPAKFSGGIYDGQGNIWMIPCSASRIVRLNAETGVMTGYSDWPPGFDGAAAYKFRSGVLDEDGGIWLIPSNAAAVIRLDTETGVMTKYADWPAGFNAGGTSKFFGGVYHDGGVWLVPSNADRVIRLDTETGVMTGYSDWPSGFDVSPVKFTGGVVDSDGGLWMIPCNANMVVKLNPDDGSMTGYSAFPSGISASDTEKFAGGVPDSQGNIWMVPNNAGLVVKINTATGVMTGYDGWPSGFSAGNSNKFFGGAFDGRYIWLSPQLADVIVRLDPSDGSMTAHGFNLMLFDGHNSTKFMGGVYDGQSVWFIPYRCEKIMRISSVTPGPSHPGAQEPTPAPTPAPTSTPEPAPTEIPATAPPISEKPEIPGPKEPPDETPEQQADTSTPTEESVNEAQADKTVVCTLTAISNKTDKTAYRYMVIDRPSANLRLVSGSLPAFTKGDGLTYSVLYKTNKQTAYKEMASGISAGSPYTLLPPALAPDEFLTEITVFFDEVPAGFAKGNVIIYTFLASDENYSNEYFTYWNSGIDDWSLALNELNNAINNSLNNYSEGDYSAASWERLMSAIQDAQNIINDPYSTAAQIEAAYGRIAAARDALEPLPGNKSPSVTVLIILFSLSISGSLLLLWLKKRNRARPNADGGH